MRTKRFPLFVSALVLAMLAMTLTVRAQQHTATRLGDPATRFAPALKTPEDLRALFANEALKPDVLFILRRAGWEGDPNDLWRAARTAEVRAVTLPKGTRIPYMSSREQGRPIVLRDVLWAGAEPIDAYEFLCASKGMRYRVITPKPCSNFWVAEVGPEPPPFVARPALALTKTMPAEISVCRPFEAVLAVRNTGNIPLTGVRLTDTLPSGFRTMDDQPTLALDVGTLEPGRGMQYTVQLKPGGRGRQENRVQATAVEGVSAEAIAETLIRAPALRLSCQSGAEAVPGRPVNICLVVENVGDATEPRVTLTLPIPGGVTVAGASEGGVVGADRVTWEIAELGAGDDREVCASVTVVQPGAVSLPVSARGECAPPVETTCGVAVAGIPAILLEVVDLDDPIEVGSPETYEIRVTNQGSADGTNIRLVCTIEESQEFLSATGPTPIQTAGRTLTSEPLPVLAPKAKAAWRVTVRASTAGDVRFAVQLTSDQIERPVEETEATHQY